MVAVFLSSSMSERNTEAKSRFHRKMQSQRRYSLLLSFFNINFRRLAWRNHCFRLSSGKSMTDHEQNYIVISNLLKTGIVHSWNMFPSSTRPSPKRHAKIRREQTIFWSRYHSNSASTRSKSKENLYHLLDERIQRLINAYDEVDLIEYFEEWSCEYVCVQWSLLFSMFCCPYFLLFLQ
jgi:hypothetical protein